MAFSLSFFPNMNFWNAFLLQIQLKSKSVPLRNPEQLIVLLFSPPSLLLIFTIYLAVMNMNWIYSWLFVDGPHIASKNPTVLSWGGLWVRQDNTWHVLPKSNSHRYDLKWLVWLELRNNKYKMHDNLINLLTNRSPVLFVFLLHSVIKFLAGSWEFSSCSGF